jgi:transcriptional regulator with PAS, ATPase and Fis domain
VPSSNPQLGKKLEVIRGYGISVLSVLAALLISSWPVVHLESAHVSLSLCAVILSAWFGGAGPGLLAAVLSAVAFYHGVLPPVDSFAAKPAEAPRFIVFVLSALFVGALSVAQRRATESLRGTRDDLNETVQDLKKTNEALGKSEAYLAEVQKLSHTGSFGWNRSTGERFWSEETFRIFGYDRTLKPTLQMVLERVHPEDVQFVREALAAASQQGKDLDFERRLLMPDGSVKKVHVLGHASKPEAGELSFLGAVMDITVMKNAFEEIQTLRDQLYKENLALREEIDVAKMFEEIVGSSPALQAVLSQVAKVAPTDSTVLITGETGTGKELIARAIHKRSQRSSRAFVSVNCAAIPRDLIASELFGHEKGAFTGATQRRLGRFESAEGGTIFLDEVGELPAETQISLLRVLQEREFQRIGGNESLQVDVRVVAATNRELQAAIADGGFREDLFYRLNVFPIEVPPLRQRKEDIPLLVEYFVDRYASQIGKKITSINKRSLDLLQSYAWPGNIRELQNVIERSVIICDSENLSVDESWFGRRAVPADSSAKPLSEKLAAQEKDMIEAALAESNGRVSGPSGAAAKLGIPQSTLDSRIKSLKINKQRFRKT